jgi:hypothetical protein
MHHIQSIASSSIRVSEDEAGTSKLGDYQRSHKNKTLKDIKNTSLVKPGHAVSSSSSKCFAVRTPTIFWKGAPPPSKNTLKLWRQRTRRRNRRRIRKRLSNSEDEAPSPEVERSSMRSKVSSKVSSKLERKSPPSSSNDNSASSSLSDSDGISLSSQFAGYKNMIPFAQRTPSRNHHHH